MPTLILAGKDLRLLLRDARSGVILLLMPLVFVAVLGMAVGEGFGQKPDDRLRLSIVNLDEGLPPGPHDYPKKPWSEVVIDDLASTADIRIEIIPNRAEAESLVRQGKRAAVLVFEPGFSREMDRCSFLTIGDPPPLNPLYVNGVDVGKLGLNVLSDPTQQAAVSIIEQVAQVTLLRVVFPWMIGKAFERVGDDDFMKIMARHFEPKLATVYNAKLALGGSMLAGDRSTRAIPPGVLRELRPVVEQTFATLLADDKFLKDLNALMRKEAKVPEFLLRPMMERIVPELQKLLIAVFADDALLAKIACGISFADLLTPEVQKAIGPGVKQGIVTLFSNYNFTAKTWAGLTRHDERAPTTANRTTYAGEPTGLLKRGALRYQILVPSYTVMFAFFLVLTVGWLFVAERRQGTLVRLRAAPLTRGQLLLGKLLPCLLLSLFQGIFLLTAGKAVFGLRWGPEPLWLLAVVASTSLAAMGLAMLIAALAKTETQVAVYGSLLVLVLGAVSGSLMPRDLMPENMRQFSYVTPHAWALDAYAQLLINPTPQLAIVGQACLVLVAFGLGFLALAWCVIQLD
jgi:ABC-2 type transport system permease protein